MLISWCGSLGITLKVYILIDSTIGTLCVPRQSGYFLYVRTRLKILKRGGGEITNSNQEIFSMQYN
jgi:hypothetical protein